MLFAGQFAGFTISESDIGLILLIIMLYIHGPMLLALGVLHAVRWFKFKLSLKQGTRASGMILGGAVFFAGVIALFTKQDGDIGDSGGTVLFELLAWPTAFLVGVSAVLLLIEILYWFVIGIVQLLRKNRFAEAPIRKKDVVVEGMPSTKKKETIDE